MQLSANACTDICAVAVADAFTNACAVAIAATSTCTASVRYQLTCLRYISLRNLLQAGR